MTKPMLSIAALLLLTGCAGSSSTKLGPPPSTSPLECQADAVDLCDGPVDAKAADLAGQDEEDTQNRERWKVCILRQKAAVACLRAAESTGRIHIVPKRQEQ